MHFSKTYAQLLESLPHDLRDNAIEYRQLKKLINQVVEELTSLGLSPELLHQLLQEAHSSSIASFKGKEREQPHFLLDGTQISTDIDSSKLPRITYELNTESNEIQPRLRMWTYEDHLETSNTPSEPSSSFVPPSHDDVPKGGPSSSPETSELREVVIPLASDTAFFQALVHAHTSLSSRLTAVSEEFRSNLDVLARDISSTAKPMSEASSFQPYSHDSNPLAITVRAPNVLTAHFTKSDLYAWREIFQLYMDAEVFESQSEESRGERAIEDAEERLAKFMQQLTERGFSDGSRLKLQRSKHAMRKFLELNASVLNLFKFQYATTEAIRKILKKHAKRTALPGTPDLPSPFVLSSGERTTVLIRPRSSSNTSLAMMLVQAIGQTLLPIVPHIDDYACVICTNIAFKPIRLRCGHLFCVRCLVKMQKRGQGNCPMCRSPTVLVADRSNVDWALLNFMRDWFPMESKKKLRQNEQEVAQEQMEELGLNVNDSCVIA
ncbi:hypothetical protein QCA50_007299 [Cerrena zonata]|uniref:Uncharacterized protein n=1 Tax=Cerrena zonata TaxID=2478898 RepID=A0AAW0GD87_9APHY